MKKQKDILVLGIGNEFRCDDGVGLCVIDEMRKDDSIQDVDFMKMKPDGYSMIEVWKNRELVIIVDAAMSGGPTGTIRRFDALAESIPHNLSPLSTHSISLAETVELADTLKQLPERLVIYAIEIGNITYGQELSPEVREAEQEVIKKIKELIESERAGKAEV